MEVTVSIPQRIHGVTVAVGCQNLVSFHLRILSIDILQDIGMNHCMIKGSVEHTFLFFRTSFHQNPAQVFIPFLAGLCTDLIKSRTGRLFRLKIQAGILDADKRNSDADFNGFTFCCVKGKPRAYIVSAHFLGIRSIEFILSGISVPFSFDSLHRPLEFPVTAGGRGLVNTHDKINGEYSLRIVAERTQQLGAFNLTIIDETHGSSGFIGQPFSQIHQQISLSAMESKTGTARTGSSRHLTLDAILGQHV